MSQMPEIKPVVNKEPERDKKKAGLLARLFGGGGSGGAGGFGGMGGGAGGSGGLGGLAGGGLLATKAGLLALILAGTTVAGGIGMIGYRLFGPGSEMTGNGDNLQLFASKPKETGNADGQGAKDGTSASLQYLSQANSTPKEADASAAGAVKDATAAGAAGASGAETAAASSGGAGPLNAAGSGANGVSKGLLKNAGKFGALSAPGGGGGGSAPVANSAPQKSALLDPGAKGSLSSFKKPSGTAISGGTNRSIAGRHFNSAFGQGIGAVRDNRGAQSSAAGGATYDGAAAGGSNIGANGTPIGGAGEGAGGAQPKTLAGPSTDLNTSSNIPTPPAKPEAPWAKQLQTAEILIGIAAACLMVCSMINKPPTVYSTWIVRILGGVVALLGAMVIAIGASIASKYGQKQFGLLGLGIGGLLIALGANAMFTKDPPPADKIASSGGSAVASTVTSAMSGATSALPAATQAAVVPPVVPPSAPPPIDSSLAGGPGYFPPE